jgi:cbb3-type cytochrome oxidase subunit 3
MDPFVSFLAEYGFFLGMPLLFIAIVIWVFRPSAKKRYQADGNLPFYGEKKQASTRANAGAHGRVGIKPPPVPPNHAR